ncbi:MAG: roadblock/LC7 domain-containing protein [Candidatus Bathyarchaeota archaeon]|nr:roadblock/LC7 domain-containing protein [Candidatus Bathyarchaeota archaeon]MDH5733894.1 roadblock/LC7 domain-containing protein [Candidatus Bathyarchaeota archaeon]
MREKSTSHEAVESLRLDLDKIKREEGIIGYILRSAKSASIDIKDPSKIIDYATLSSTALKSGENISEVFGLGDVSSVVVEGNEAKVLAMSVGGFRVSIFMRRDVDHNRFYEDLHLE